MKIKKKRVNNIKNILDIIGEKNFYITSIIDEKNIKSIGFTKLIVGEEILPSIQGPISKFNRNGKEVIHEPKVREIVKHTMPYNIIDWHGTPHSGHYVRTFNRWKKDFIEPLNEKVLLKESNNNAFTVSTRLILFNETTEVIKHLINLMLELGKEIDIVDENSNSILPSKRVSWKILPPGEMPWEKYYNSIQEKVKNYDKNEIVSIKDRYEFLQSLNPKSIICGDGGFDGYFIAELDCNLYICDSIFLGNAIYILNDNWEDISKLTKKEIISNNFAKQRIVHIGDWKTKVLNLINSSC